jgi:hypothetical protein
MRRLAVALLAVALLATSAVAIGGGSVAAQSSDNATAPTPEERAADVNRTSVVAEVDDQLRVLGYSYDDDDETMTVVLEAREGGSTRSQVTISEVISSRTAQGSGSFGVEQVSLEPGEEIAVSVSAQRVDGTAAVMIVSQRSLRRGQGTFVSDSDSVSLFTGPATWGYVRLSSIAAAAGAVIVVLLGSWHIIADRADRAEVRV